MILNIFPPTVIPNYRSMLIKLVACSEEKKNAFYQVCISRTCWVQLLPLAVSHLFLMASLSPPQQHTFWSKQNLGKEAWTQMSGPGVVRHSIGLHRMCLFPQGMKMTYFQVGAWTLFCLQSSKSLCIWPQDLPLEIGVRISLEPDCNKHQKGWVNRSICVSIYAFDWRRCFMKYLVVQEKNTFIISLGYWPRVSLTFTFNKVV